jgi:hypothetical protein
MEMTERKKPDVTLWASAAVAALVATAAYVLAYLSLVQPEHPDHWSGWAFADRPTIIPLSADYSGKTPFGGRPPRNQKSWARFFAPIHTIDRTVRPHVWNSKVWFPASLYEPPV